MGRDDQIDEPVPNFQCPSCGKMSVVKGYFQTGKVEWLGLKGRYAESKN
jgi:hypothetical protein